MAEPIQDAGRRIADWLERALALDGPEQSAEAVAFVRPPGHPGAVLGLTLRRYGITQQQLADATGVSRFRINEIINGKRAMTPDSAVRIGAALMQARFDLYEARCGLIDAVDNIVRLR
jgi:addiction module HigA family antidote